MVGSAARSRGVGSNESGQDKRDWEKFPHTVERNLPLTYGLTFGTCGFADPCVLGEPLVRDEAQPTVSAAKKYRGRAEGRRFNVSPVEIACPVFGQRIIIMPIRNTPPATRGLCVLSACEEKIKAQ
jgi:hypothetical protein